MSYYDQKLVNLCFELVLASSSDSRFSKKTISEKSDWVSSMLEASGVKTTPVGACFGVILNNDDDGHDAMFRQKLVNLCFELVLASSSTSFFCEKTTLEKSDWVSSMLEASGVKTTP